MLRAVFGLSFGLLLTLGAIPLVSAGVYYDNYDHRDLVVLVETRSGNFVIDFFYDDAPNHVENFLKLTDEGFYDGVFFHRIIPDFMIQGGDPKTIKSCENCPNIHSDFPESEWGTGGPEHYVLAEFNDIKHNRGIVSMARSMDPNSAGSQFFIIHKDSNFLDGEYTVFGRIVTQESFTTLDRIANVDLVGETPKNPEQTRIDEASIMLRKNVHEYLNLGPPERTGESMTTQATEPGVFRSERLGIQMKFPIGWLVQEPVKTSPDSPDVYALGPAVGSIPQAMTLTILDTNGLTFEQLITQKINALQPRIDDGSLELKYNDAASANGRDVYSIYAQGFFVNTASTQSDDFTPEETIDVVFAEVLIYDSPKHYIISTSSDQLGNFPKQVALLEEAVYSFQEISSQQTTTQQNFDEIPKAADGGGCLIATAAYGSEMAPQVQLLREIRDNTVLQTQSGTAFMTGFNQLYYSFSPTIADYERENPVFKEAVKLSLTPMLTSLALLNYVDIDTEQEMLGYGVGVILLNIGMYFVAPAAVIIAIKNRKK